MKLTVLLFIFLGIALFVISACFSKKKKKPNVVDPMPSAIFPYRLNAPSSEIELPKKLNEISDLSFDAAANVLWAVTDEKGNLYRIQLPSGGPIDNFPFGEDGDYEGVEKVGDLIYAMESNGRITQIEQATSPNPVVGIFKNAQLEKDDCEAFMYDPLRNKLVIGVKLPASGGDSRPFYAFDMETKLLDPTPIFSISLGDIQAFLRKNGRDGEQYKQWVKNGAVTPSPSAIAIHPKSGNFYILASVGKTLLVTNPYGEILEVVALDKKLHPKAEGIAFGPNGTMYISTEADSDVARLYVYEPEL